MIVPVSREEAGPAAPSGINDAHIVYAIAPSHVLPVIDRSKTIQSLLLRGPTLERYRRMVERYGRVLIVTFSVGSLLSCGFPLYDRSTGQWVALLAAILQLFPLAFTIMLLRYDLLRLLMSTYEFWYFTVTNVGCNLLLGMQVADLRAALVLVLICLFETTLVIDASFRLIRTMVVMTTVGAMALAMLLVYEAFGLLRDVDQVTVFSYSPWTLDASDIILNGGSMIIVVLLRNVYRKRTATLRVSHQRKIIQCVTYRSRIKLVLACSTGVSQSTAVPRGQTQVVFDDCQSMSQLRMVPSGLRIYAHDVMLGQLPPQLSPRVQFLWHGVGYAGMLSMVVSTSLPQGHPCETWVYSLACVGTALYCIPCFLCHNRILLWRMLWSFDFLFVGVQVLLAHLTVGYLFHWNWHCMPALVSWVWMHWVFTLDLLTPVVRRRLGLQPHLAIMVLLLQIVGQLALPLEVIVLRHWGVTDRVVYSFTVGGKTVSFRAIPFLFGRLFTSFCWCWRLLYRLWRRSDGELMLMLGAVEYDDQIYSRQNETSSGNRQALEGGGENMKS